MKDNGIKSRKQKRKKRNVAIGVVILMLFFITVTLIMVGNQLKKQSELEEEKKEVQKVQEAEVENVKELLDRCYASFLPVDCAMEVVDIEEESFSQWLLKELSENQMDKLLKAAKNGELTEVEIYDSTGETVHVLSDRYEGLLEDEEAATQNNIYIREGKKKGEAEITIAGDLCLTEDGFVIDKYDTVNDLKQCISPEILQITNESDLFYVNHEYTISDRGTPLAGKYYTFRAKPERMSILKEMGTDIVSLANNHVYDYGEEALLDTVDFLEKASIPYVGGGRNIDEAKRPIYFIINGIKIGFVGASNGERF